MMDITRAFSLNFLIPSNDGVIGRLLRNHGEFARIESDLIIEYLKIQENGAYLDVGGNIGTIALPVAAALPETKVIAIEAQRIVASILAANALNNHLYNVDVIHAAAGAEMGLMSFPQGNLHRGQTNFGVVGAHIKVLPMENVRVCTLDEIAPDNTRFVKIDVEGFEGEVLKGSARLLKDIRPIWLLEASLGAATEATIQTMLDAGYRLFWFYAPFVTPMAPKLPSVAQNKIGDMNFLALPEGVPNIWNLPEFDSPVAPRPQRLAIFKYLERVKFKLKPL